MHLDERPFRLSYPVGFLLKVVFSTGLSCVVGVMILRWIFFRELIAGDSAAVHVLEGLRSFLAPSLLFSALAVLLAASAAVAVVAVLDSHRIAGPLFHLERVVGYLQHGVLVGHIHLRPRDHGKAVAQALNDWLGVRKSALRQQRSQVARCSELLRSCEQLLAEGRVEEASAILEELPRAWGGFSAGGARGPLRRP